jgi:hypothetical protein
MVRVGEASSIVSFDQPDVLEPGKCRGYRSYKVRVGRGALACREVLGGGARIFRLEQDPAQ